MTTLDGPVPARSQRGHMAVIKMYPHPVEQEECVDSRLLSLRSLGFQFTAHHGVIDVLQLYGEHDADAIRIPDDEPDILFPSTTIWRTTGTATTVIDDLLNLADPEPAEPNIPRPRRAGFWTDDRC